MLIGTIGMAHSLIKQHEYRMGPQWRHLLKRLQSIPGQSVRARASNWREFTALATASSLFGYWITYCTILHQAVKEVALASYTFCSRSRLLPLHTTKFK